MQREGDDDAWRSIIENFGERAELDPEDETTPPRRPEPVRAEDVGPAPPTHVEGTGELDRDAEASYVPPEPEPFPLPEPDRGIAWIGVIGSPLLLLVSLVAGIGLPSWVGYLMIAWFVGGFCYLVARMPKEPRDPWDDGSRV